MVRKYNLFFIVSIILFPSFFGYIGLNAGQAIYLAFIVLLSIAPFFYNLRYIKNPFINRNILFLILSFLLLFIEYSISSIINFKRNSYGVNDIIEILRPLIYLFCFLSCYIIVNRNSSEATYLVVDKIERIIFLSSFFEWFKFIKIFSPLFKLYSVFPYGSVNYIRMSGMTGFAYNYAWIIIFCVYWNVLRNRKITLRFFYYSIVIFLTGSRTGFAALCLSYVVIFLCIKQTRKTLGLALVIMITFMVVLYFLGVEVVVTAVDYILRLIRAFLGKTLDASMLTRKSQNAEALQFFDEAALFGIASNKAKNRVIENFYFHHIRNWGLLGLSIYILILISFFLLTGKSYKSFVFVLLSTAFLICFSSPLFDQIRVFNILYLVLSFTIHPNFSEIPVIKKKRKRVKFIRYLK